MSSLRMWLGLGNRLRQPRVRRHALNAIWTFLGAPQAECNICGYKGSFDAAGTIMRFNAACPQCASVERYRLLALAMQRSFVSFADCDVLHFAPESAIIDMVREQAPRSYVTGDILMGRADRQLNIEALDIPDASLDRIVCLHVLEHVNDAVALAELRRVLRPGGQAVLMVPIVEGWQKSYENPDAITAEDRTFHYGQDDHIRYYGADFRDRVRAAGFTLTEFTAEGLDSVRFNLMRGEKVFLATR